MPKKEVAKKLQKGGSKQRSRQMRAKMENKTLLCKLQKGNDNKYDIRGVNSCEGRGKRLPKELTEDWCREKAFVKHVSFPQMPAKWSRKIVLIDWGGNRTLGGARYSSMGKRKVIETNWRQLQPSENLSTSPDFQQFALLTCSHFMPSQRRLMSHNRLPPKRKSNRRLDFAADTASGACKCTNLVLETSWQDFGKLYMFSKQRAWLLRLQSLSCKFSS